MELFAAGINAWNQLSFESPRQQEAGDQEPHDLCVFTKVLEAHSVERPVARLSYTIVRRDGRLCLAGLGPEGSEELEFLYSAAETANGEILTIQSSSGNSSNVLLKYPFLAAWKSGMSQPSPWPCTKTPAKQLAAFDTGFVILYEDGSVATCGDARFGGSLGRDITAEQPAETPGPVPDLHDINGNDPVRHVTAGGHSLAALTDSGSIYVWGTASPGSVHRRRQALQGIISSLPEYTEVDGDKDVADVALGDSHAVALTTDGCVYVVGENNNGQLGVGREVGERVEEWTKVLFEVAAGYEIVGVAAGPKSSFILTSEMEDSGARRFK